jgi:hypothetical protein
MARRKQGNSHTTISITWEDKEEFRKYAKYEKQTRTGKRYESDATLFKRLLEEFKKHNSISDSELSHSTYPSRSS